MSAQALAVLRHIRRVEQALEKYREPIEAQPFLHWCTRREDQIRREIDHYPAITGSRDGGAQASGPQGIDPRGRLAMQLGWDPDTGCRRLWRWRHENIAGLVERAIVEEALFTAGVAFEDVYPDETARTVVIRLGQGRYMTDQQVIAAHTVYMRGKLTMSDIAEQVWERYGFINQASACQALGRGFRSLGLPVRECHGIGPRGRCRKQPTSGSDHCAKHNATPAWTVPDTLIEQAHTMYDHGTPFYVIARELVAQTPWQHPRTLEKKIAAAAREQGWHASMRGQMPPNHVAAA